MAEVSAKHTDSEHWLKTALRAQPGWMILMAQTKRSDRTGDNISDGTMATVLVGTTPHSRDRQASADPADPHMAPKRSHLLGVTTGSGSDRTAWPVPHLTTEPVPAAVRKHHQTSLSLS